MFLQNTTVSKMKNISVLFLSLICFSNISFSQESEAIDSVTIKKDWSFYAAPYVFFAAQATDVGGEQIRQSFNDLSSLTNSGFQIVTGVRYKRWNAFMDGTFAVLGAEEQSGALDIDFKIIQTILDLRLGYTLIEDLKLKDDVVKGWSMEINAGTTYWRNDLSVDYRISIGDNIIIDDNIEEILRWWDLMVGAKFDFFISKRVFLGVGGSVGGFGIGNSSDFAYNFVYSNTFILKDYFRVSAGFKSLQYSRNDDELETTVKVLGPFVGVVFNLDW